MSLMISRHTEKLEAVFREPQKESFWGVAVICHPHPLYGGNMDNRVVYRASKAANLSGLAALRFNFRGVGASTGSFDEGEGEKDDVLAVIDWLEQKYPKKPLAVVGYSFGAWVGMRVGSLDTRVKALVGLGLPLNSCDFSFLLENSKPALLVVGSRDEMCAPEMLNSLGPKLPTASSLHVLDGADHFFNRGLDQAQNLITDFLSRRMYPGQ